MDVYESKKALGKLTAVVDTTRRPLIPAEKNNAVTAASRRPRTREIGSRYKSPTPCGSSRRCSSPNIQRALSSDSQLVPKRAVSAERKRPQTPTSPTAPCTPVADSSIELPVSSRRMSTGRLPESLWPSTMRSLSVSFQSDTISIPVVKKEKQVNVSLIDRTLRPSSNVAHRQGVPPSVSRKPTPERKRSPLRGKNPSDQSENSKPVNSSRTIDQHRWPSRTAGKVNPNSLNKSLDFSDKAARVLSSPVPVMGLSLRRMSLPLQKSSSDTARLLSSDETSGTLSPPKPPLPHRLLSATTSLDRTTLTNAASRLHSLPSSQSRQASPSRNCLSSSSSSSSSRGVSPSHVRPTTPLRGASPSRIRQSSSCTQSSSSSSNNSVLTFVADVKKGKKAGYIEDAHQLRMFYNRLLQWRFSNAQADAVMYNQKLTSEETLCNVWHETSDLRDIVTSKRIHLQQMKLQIKLRSILNDQMEYLEEWALLEREHVSYLTGAIEDLQANTLRLPVTGGAKADVESLKVAISSAVDVMQAMGSTMFSSVSMVEEMNSLASNLATVATQEKSMLGKCKDLLASTASMQIEASSLITHLIQMKEDTTAMDPGRVFAN